MKKNIKLIVGIIIGIAIGAASGIGVYATLTYNAGDIAYTKSGASTPINVSSALNELYQNKKVISDDVKNVTTNGNITLDKYYKNLNVNIPIPSGYAQVSGTKTITAKANNIDVSNYQYIDTTGMYTATEYQNYGNTQYTAGANANANSVANAVGYKTGIYTPTSAGKNYIECGFKPKNILISGGNTDGSINRMVYLYKSEQSTSNSYKVNFLNGNILTNESRAIAMEGDSSITENSLHIYKVDNSGFGFYFTNTDKKIYWTAFK